MSSRRDAMRTLAAGGLALASGLAPIPESKAAGPSDPKPSALPRWRGFNLLEKFQVDGQRPYEERDFAEIAELGFDFVRLPIDYRCYTEPGDWRGFREAKLREVDDAVEFGKKHGVHVQINLHRAPGYTVASPPEAKSVWTDPEAQDVCALHWAKLAGRYAGMPNSAVSFNPFNEPARVGPEAHRKAVERMCEAIRGVDKARLIVCDGREWGTVPPDELADLGVAAATRGYAPFRLTHYGASWVEGSDRWPRPGYPLTEGGSTWDASALRRDQIEPWKRLQATGMGVMVGEFGCHNRTPHAAVLAWMADCLAAWKAAGWGWALWNYRGSFGPLDSGRDDVRYEEWKGHKLDRAMLDRLKAG